MTRVLAALAAAIALSACANAIDSTPSYLGMATGSVDAGDHEAAPRAKPMPAPAAIRHVSSNRVLGAMAFQKVTGAEVDPRTLAGPGGQP